MRTQHKAVLALLVALVMIVLLWATNTVKPLQLMHEVTHFYEFPFLESSYLYFYLLLFTISFPLGYSFDEKIAFYKNWSFLFPAILLTSIPFLWWDVFFTKWGVWDFNPDYLSGIYIFNLPLEECLFFIIIPYSCLFIYESVNYFSSRDYLAKFDRKITGSLAFITLIIGMLFWENIYTATTFLLCGILLCFHYLFIPNSYRSRFYLAYLITFIPFSIVNGALTGGFTANPVVLYNPEEYLGFRMVSIPIDDAVYSFLLLLLNTTLYEYFKQAKERRA